MFRVEERTGDLVLSASPDREERDTYILRIKVKIGYFGTATAFCFFLSSEKMQNNFAEYGIPHLLKPAKRGNLLVI